MPKITDKALFIILAFLVGIIVALGVYTKILYSENKNLNKTITTLSSKIAVKEVEKIGLENSIKSQNIQIEKVSINLDEKRKELEEWKNKPPDIKYKEVIKIKEVKSNECEDVKNIINHIRTTSF